ncbi:hypothetical protein EI048_01085 [Escherichia coli]|nr:hypothetical protein [Escherichia coli]EFC6939448.1 hypothetical protein [Escherichia coli]EFH9203103.1 hypothetical protein [Escherichia coli]EFN6255051.1 hypothetical protein [Escherichia coli]MQI02068.1 hypothetical protein [Escherichia coli]
MSSHDRLRIGLAKTCQNWRAFAHVMQVHENYYIKRAGVAGIRARARYRNSRLFTNRYYDFQCSFKLLL